MAVHLLDVNVLLALGWPQHVHYDAAHRWFKSIASDGWATCPMTQCGFVRPLSNPRVVGVSVSISSAVKELTAMTAQAGHVFWPDDLALDSAHFPTRRLQGHRQVTDAYLVALCSSRGGILATFDAGAQSLAPPGLVKVIAAK